MESITSFWSKEETIKTIQFSEDRKLIISYCEKGTNKFLSIREWYCDEESGEYRPSKRGANFLINKSETLKEIIDSLNIIYKNLENSD